MKTKANKFFTWVTKQYRPILVISILLIALAASQLPKLQMNTSVSSFIADDNPVLEYRDQVREIFGLKDPIVIAVYNENGIYNETTLRLISEISDKVLEIPGIDTDQVTSIATEKNIVGTEDGLVIDYFYETDNINSTTPLKVKESLKDFDVYQGNLISKDGKMALIIAEILDGNLESGQAVGAAVYENLMAMAETLDKGDNQVHIAGIGAVEETLMYKIDVDAKRLNPLVGLMITLILILAYRTLRATLIPNTIVAATALGGIGMMAFLGIDFYVITNALPPILIAIAVADSIHVFGQYYEEIQAHPHLGKQEVIIQTMENIWRPILLTSITTISGFIGIAMTSSMPPFTYFGWFAALGVLIALLYSVILLPAALMIGKIKPSKAFLPEKKNNDGFSRFMWAIGKRVVQYPKATLVLTAFLLIISIPGALKLKVDYAPIDNLKSGEPIRKADKLMNAHMNGTTILDIIVETENEEGLYKPTYLNKIEQLQKWITSIDHVNGSTSIVDIIKKMNQSLNQNDRSAYKIPNDELLISQEIFLYGASNDPVELDKYVDSEYKTANIRVFIDDAFFQTKRKISQKVQHYIDTHFNGNGIQASLSGNVAIDYEYMKDLGRNHFTGTIVALLLILLVSSLVFKSVTAGLYSALPVAIAIFLIYTIMGHFKIWMGIGTTMFSAIAIGLGVDFAIHTIERLVYFLKDKGMEKNEAFKAFYLSTGRALLFNLMAFVFGFGIMMTSSVTTLIYFGLLLVVAVAASFLASITILPALIYVFNPKFVRQKI